MLRLEAIAADRNCPQKHVCRANIALLTGAGCGTAEIMRRTGKAKTCVWRWQERYMQAGVDGLLKDKTRPSRKPSLPTESVARVVELTLSFSARLYRQRNAIERFFNKLKHFRAVATRYDKRDDNFLAGVKLASV